MAQNERSTNQPHFIADMGLTIVAVFVVAVTFLGVSGLTPRLTDNNASTNVLGVATNKKSVSYRPADVSQLAYIADFTFTDSTTLTGNSLVAISFNPLKATTYRFEFIAINNDSLEYRKVRLTPSFSLGGSYTSIQLIFAGQTVEIVTPQGGISPQDLVLPPNSSSAAELIVQPVSPLALPTTLTLSFTELP